MGNVLVSEDKDGGPANDHSDYASISADGRFVVFESEATDIVAGDTNGASDVFLRDVEAGTTTLVSTDTAGGPANDLSGGPDISSDGHWVVFASNATDLVADDTNGLRDVFLWERTTGDLTRVTEAPAGSGLTGGGLEASVSNSGWVAFVADQGAWLAGHPGVTPQIFLWKRSTGDVSGAAVALVTHDAVGDPAAAQSADPDISADGGHLAFESYAALDPAYDLVAGPAIYRYEVAASGLLGQSILVSRSGTVVANGGSRNPAISANGSEIAFDSTATNLSANDANGFADVFRWEYGTPDSTLLRVSEDAFGAAPAGGGSWASIGGAGATVVFSSSSGDLVNGDTNGTMDAFSWRGGATNMVVHDRFGGVVDEEVAQAQIAGAGGRVVFRARGSDLIDGGDTNGVDHIYVTAHN